MLISDLSSVHFWVIKSGFEQNDGKQTREHNAAMMTMACKLFWRSSKKGAEKKS